MKCFQSPNRRRTKAEITEEISSQNPDAGLEELANQEKPPLGESKNSRTGARDES